MTLRGVGFVLVLCGWGCASGAATGTAKGKSVHVRIEAEDRLQAAQVATASAAAGDLFDELTQTQLPKPIEIRGRLVSGGPVSPEARWESARRVRLEADPGVEDFAASWVSAVVMARIAAAAGSREGQGSYRWVAEGCTGKATPGEEGMWDRVAVRAADLEESALKKIQAWPLEGSLGADRVTRGLRRLLAARLVSRAVAAENRIRLQEWVAVGCPGNFWSDSAEVDGAWRRSLGQPDLRTGTSPRTPEQTARKLRDIAMELARSGVRGNKEADAIGVELMKLEATADPFLRPAIFRYRQAMTLGEENEDGRKEREAALKDADQAVERWRRWRVQADKLLDWYELNDPDLRLGPALRQWEESLPKPGKGGRPTGFEPATARTTIWSSTN